MKWIREEVKQHRSIQRGNTVRRDTSYFCLSSCDPLSVVVVRRTETDQLFLLKRSDSAARSSPSGFSDVLSELKTPNWIKHPPDSSQRQKQRPHVQLPPTQRTPEDK